MRILAVFILLALALTLTAGGQPEKNKDQATKVGAFGGKSTMGGNPVNLEGQLLQVGQTAPDFQLVDSQLNQVTLADLGTGKKILNIVTSLDTSVCQEQTSRLNQELTNLPGYKVFTISADLPFAQQRWAKEAGVDGTALLSSYQSPSFGQAYGLQVHEIQLLNRAIIILDEKNTVSYVEKVDEMFNHPDYEAALKAAHKI